MLAYTLAARKLLLQIFLNSVLIFYENNRKHDNLGNVIHKPRALTYFASCPPSFGLLLLKLETFYFIFKS